METVRKFYDETVDYEWNRLDRHKVEYELTKRFLKRYIQPMDTVLDLGGGPGKYALHLSELGCDVTLADLSPTFRQIMSRLDWIKPRSLDCPCKACVSIAGI